MVVTIVGIYEMFQFLIGRLKTNNCIPDSMIAGKLFQFLIGRLKTIGKHQI